MLHLLFNPFGLGVLAGAGGLWLAKKYEAQTRRLVDDVTTKGSELITKFTPAKAPSSPPRKTSRKPELGA